MSKPVTPFGKYHQHHQDMFAEVLFVCLFCRNSTGLVQTSAILREEKSLVTARNITSQGVATVLFEASIICSL